MVDSITSNSKRAVNTTYNGLATKTEPNAGASCFGGVGLAHGSCQA